MDRYITEKDLAHFQAYLYEEEKSSATIQKYMCDVKKLLKFSKGGKYYNSMNFTVKTNRKKFVSAKKGIHMTNFVGIITFYLFFVTIVTALTKIVLQTGAVCQRHTFSKHQIGTQKPAASFSCDINFLQIVE